MSQCVPNWDIDDAHNSTPIDINALAPSASNSLCTDVPSMDYEVAELTWENGQLAMHGLGAPRQPTKLLASDTLLKEAWEKPRAGGTLESIVSQATCMPTRKRGGGVEGVVGGEMVPWFDPNNHRQLVAAAKNPGAASSSATLTMDALVPCSKPTSPPIPRWPGHEREPSAAALGFSGHVGSCSVLPGGGRVRGGGAREMSVSASATYSKDSRQMSMTDTRGERDVFTEGFTSTSMASPENTSSEKQCTLKSVDDNDHSVCHSRSQRDNEMDEKKDGKSSVSTKRSRAAATHNQSERKRRDKINQRMKTLQKLVPNSSKTDKASMLDEVIEYLKQLQSQIHMMSRMNMPPAMMFPLAMQQQLQMSMMGPAAAAAMGMGIAGMMDMNNIAAGRSNMAAAMPQLLNPAAAASAAAAFMPMAAAWWDQGSAAAAAERMPAAAPAPVMADHLAAFLACQSQPITADAYTRMATMYQQQFQQATQGASKN
ncbi:unnamed protein product [Cuscuta campestris]|uniref:BHLH domain-containing protein n=1 Tax=Cuscuta campestris TaxID=132261 RepID=A0A484MH68_9ASTE|nr:unnamed protein product [Cuscuta campestris]